MGELNPGSVGEQKNTPPREKKHRAQNKEIETVLIVGTNWGEIAGPVVGGLGGFPGRSDIRPKEAGREDRFGLGHWVRECGGRIRKRERYSKWEIRLDIRNRGKTNRRKKSDLRFV